MFFFLYFYAYSINKKKIYFASFMHEVDVRRRKKRSMNLINVKYMYTVYSTHLRRTDQPRICIYISLIFLHDISHLHTTHTKHTHTHFSHYNIFLLLFLCFSSASSQSIINVYYKYFVFFFFLFSFIFKKKS